MLELLVQVGAVPLGKQGPEPPCATCHAAYYGKTRKGVDGVESH